MAKKDDQSNMYLNLRSGPVAKQVPGVSADPSSPNPSPTHVDSNKLEFEDFVRRGIMDIKATLKGFEEALEFQGRRTSDLEKRMDPLEKKVATLETEIDQHEQRLMQAVVAENKLERFSRRNNFRIVGLPLKVNENPMEVAKEFLKLNFGIEGVIERAHRDGPKIRDFPRHMLVKILSYQDKRYVLSQQRVKLQNVRMYVIDDLTKIDREEKKKWKEEVQRAFLNKVRYHFSAGKWRDGRGMPAPFYGGAQAPITIHEDTPSKHGSPHHDRNPPLTMQSPPNEPAVRQRRKSTTNDVQDGSSSRRSTRVVTAQVHTEDLASSSEIRTRMNGLGRSFFILLVISVTVCADKIFLTDLRDSAIYVGDNSGPNFFSSSFQKLPVSGVEDPVGVDYDYRNEMVYWTDESRRIISRAKLDGSMQEVLVDEFQGVGYPEGLVLDLEDERMIWTDTSLKKIESANLDGSSRKSIISTGLFLPWSITLSYKRKMLYWTEHGDDEYIGSKIEMANKYGLNRRALVSTRVKQPNSVALDSQEQRLYWTEGFYDVIESIDLDTLDRQVHVYAESGDIFVFGISLYFDSIYFTELGSSVLYEADLGKQEIRNVSVHSFPAHVKVYADLTCPSSECRGHSTCELIGYATPSCTCLPGYTGPTCNEQIICPLPSNVNPDTHFVDPGPVYYDGQTLVEVCDNGNDKRTHVCNGFTGDWYSATSIDCTKSGSGLPQGAVIGISCGFAILAVLFLAVLWRAYASSRRTIPTISQNPIPTASYPGSSTQVQGMPTMIISPPGAVGGAAMAPSLPEKGQIQTGHSASAEMPPPDYSYVVYPGRGSNA